MFFCLSWPANSPVVGRPQLWGSASSPKELGVVTILLHKGSMMGGMLYTWGGEGTNKVWFLLLDCSQITFAIFHNFWPRTYLKVCSLVLESLQFHKIFDHPPTYDCKRNFWTTPMLVSHTSEFHHKITNDV